jgi:hypothetical protein
MGRMMNNLAAAVSNLQSGEEIDLQQLTETEQKVLDRMENLFPVTDSKMIVVAEEEPYDWFVVPPETV